LPSVLCHPSIHPLLHRTTASTGLNSHVAHTSFSPTYLGQAASRSAQPCSRRCPISSALWSDLCLSRSRAAAISGSTRRRPGTPAPEAAAVQVTTWQEHHTLERHPNLWKAQAPGNQCLLPLPPNSLIPAFSAQFATDHDQVDDVSMVQSYEAI
jgi:hypothetical protein